MRASVVSFVSLCQRGHIQCISAATDLEDDFIGGLCPDERLRGRIIVFDVIVDGAFQFRNACERTSADTLGG